MMLFVGFFEGYGSRWCVMVCMYVNDKGLYRVVNEVMERIEELNWSSGTEAGVE